MDKKQARAFEAFVNESGDALLGMATLLTSDRHVAEDVYQETLHRLSMRWSRIDNPMAFCRRVLHNIVIDQARAQQRRHSRRIARFIPPFSPLPKSDSGEACTETTATARGPVWGMAPSVPTDPLTNPSEPGAYSTATTE